MEEVYHEGKSFVEVTELVPGEYEQCRFTNCELAEKNLSGFIFVDCLFVACNLSLVTVERTSIRGTVFRDCKLVGVRFDTCNEFGLSFSFENCMLSHASFYQCGIQETQFLQSQLQEVDFSGADLTKAVFAGCNLASAVFDRTNISGADFSTSINYSISPAVNTVKKARFSASGLYGLLDQYDIEVV